MIRIEKTAEPDVLAQNAAAWTAEFIATLGRGEDPTPTQQTRYRHPTIKRALVDETHGKCAYCELKILPGSFGDIEHIIPKSLRPDLRFAWNNLTLACDVCNVKKGAYSDLIDPYLDNPEDHFQFLGPMIMVRTGSNLGLRSNAILELNRIALLEHRKEKLDEFIRRVHEISHVQDEPTKIVLLQSLIADAENSAKEFAGCTRAFIRDMRREGALPLN